MSECCKVGYSATLAGAHVHNFICSENRGFPSLGDLCIEKCIALDATDTVAQPGQVQVENQFCHTANCRTA